MAQQNPDQKRCLQYLHSVEKLAEEILSEKREIISLDRRRNENREAIRQLMKTNEKKCWLTVGSVLVKETIESAKELIESDQKQLDIDINKLRSDLKVKVNKLRDLEMQPPVPGLMLVPMSSQAINTFQSSGLIPQ